MVEPPLYRIQYSKVYGGKKNSGSEQGRTWDIIAHFMPMFWFMENPQTGMLKNQAMMLMVPYTDVDYSRYGMPYRKRTRIWNNLEGSWVPRPLCAKDCEAMSEDGRRHREAAQLATTAANPFGRESSFT